MESTVTAPPEAPPGSDHQLPRGVYAREDANGRPVFRVAHRVGGRLVRIGAFPILSEAAEAATIARVLFPPRSGAAASLSTLQVRAKVREHVAVQRAACTGSIPDPRWCPMHGSIELSCGPDGRHHRVAPCGQALEQHRVQCAAHGAARSTVHKDASGVNRLSAEGDQLAREAEALGRAGEPRPSPQRLAEADARLQQSAAYRHHRDLNLLPPAQHRGPSRPNASTTTKATGGRQSPRRPRRAATTASSGSSDGDGPAADPDQACPPTSGREGFFCAQEEPDSVGGLQWHEDRRRWTAVIRIAGEARHLGEYRFGIDAVDAWKRAAREAWGPRAGCLLSIHPRLARHPRLEWDETPQAVYDYVDLADGVTGDLYDDAGVWDEGHRRFAGVRR